MAHGISNNWPCKCGGQMEVKDSRPSAINGVQSIVRRRWCSQCKRHLSTRELIEDKLIKLVALRRDLSELADRVKKVTDAAGP